MHEDMLQMDPGSSRAGRYGSWSLRGHRAFVSHYLEDGGWRKEGICDDVYVLYEGFCAKEMWPLDTDINQ